MPRLKIHNIRRRSRRFKACADARLLLNALCFTALICTPSALADETEYQRIRQQMSKLAPLIGKWSVVATFHGMDGGVTEQVAMWSVSSVLDDTYLEFQTERHSKNTPERSAKVVWYITYNPRTNQYEITYFYNKSALRVTETGQYDDATREFRTRGYIPLEDGVNDETVRAIFSLKDQNKIVYTHYSMRTPAEPFQRVDLVMVCSQAR
jgi:hypothetical protein